MRPLMPHVAPTRPLAIQVTPQHAQVMGSAAPSPRTGSTAANRVHGTQPPAPDASGHNHFFLYAHNDGSLDPESLDGLLQSFAPGGYDYAHTPFRDWPQTPSIGSNAERSASSSPLGPNPRRHSGVFMESPPFVAQTIWPQMRKSTADSANGILPWAALGSALISEVERGDGQCRITRASYSELMQPVGVRVQGSQALHIFEWSALNQWLMFTGNFDWPKRTFINPANFMTTPMADLMRLTVTSSQTLG